MNISKIKPFDVELEHIIHFKTVEVHFNAAFGEYQILIYRCLSKILQVMLSFKTFKLVIMIYLISNIH